MRGVEAVSDQTRGLFFGPPNLVDLLRHLAAHKGRRFGLCLPCRWRERRDLADVRPELDRQARGIAAWLQAHGLQGQRALLLIPAGPGIHRCLLWLLVRGRGGRAGLPPRMNRRWAADPGYCRRLRRARRADDRRRCSNECSRSLGASRDLLKIRSRAYRSNRTASIEANLGISGRRAPARSPSCNTRRDRPVGPRA